MGKITLFSLFVFIVACQSREKSNAEKFLRLQETTNGVTIKDLQGLHKNARYAVVVGIVNKDTILNGEKQNGYFTLIGETKSHHDTTFLIPSIPMIEGKEMKIGDTIWQLELDSSNSKRLKRKAK